VLTTSRLETFRTPLREAPGWLTVGGSARRPALFFCAYCPALLAVPTLRFLCADAWPHRRGEAGPGVYSRVVIWGRRLADAGRAPMASPGSFRIAEFTIGAILVATSIVIAIFDTSGVGKLAIPATLAGANRRLDRGLASPEIEPRAARFPPGPLPRARRKPKRRL
jgi:hypothetical protein